MATFPHYAKGLATRPHFLLVTVMNADNSSETCSRLRQISTAEVNRFWCVYVLRRDSRLPTPIGNLTPAVNLPNA